MSIASITSLVSQPSPISTRSQEDVIGRQLRQAIKSGDLAGAQQAYNALSAFGANNSGPFSSPKLSQEFAAVGEALQAGDLGAAQKASNTLSRDLLKEDVKVAKQNFDAGGLQGAQRAIANLEGDYWAVTGQHLSISSPPNVAATTDATAAGPAINVQA